MRLIDTDDLKFPNIAIFNMKLHGVYVPMIRLLDVQELIPTVDAIPVKWLEQQRIDECDTASDLHNAIITYVLRMWQKGKEKQDGVYQT